VRTGFFGIATVLATLTANSQTRTDAPGVNVAKLPDLLRRPNGVRDAPPGGRLRLPHIKDRRSYFPKRSCYPLVNRQQSGAIPDLGRLN